MAGKTGNYTFHFRSSRAAAEAVENAKKGNLTVARHGNHVTVLANAYKNLFGQSHASMYGDWVFIANNTTLYEVSFNGQRVWPTTKR